MDGGSCTSDLERWTAFSRWGVPKGGRNDAFLGSRTRPSTLHNETILGLLAPDKVPLNSIFEGKWGTYTIEKHFVPDERSPRNTLADSGQDHGQANCC